MTAKRYRGVFLVLSMTVALTWAIVGMSGSATGEPEYVLLHADDLAAQHERLFAEGEFQIVDMRGEGGSVTRERLEDRLEPEEYTRTYGPLDGAARSEIRETLTLSIQSSQRSLYLMQEELEETGEIDLEREGFVLQVLARELIESRLFEAGQYITVERGDDAFVWPPPGLVTSRYPVVTPFNGRAVDVVFLMPLAEYPELRKAEADLKARRHFVAKEASYQFNSLDDAERKRHFDTYFTLREERRKPQSEEEHAVWSTLMPMLLQGVRFDRARFLILIK